MPDAASKLQKRFGDTIRTERKARRFSQEKLALESELSLTYVGELERGEKMPSLDVVLRLAKALGMTGADLLSHVALVKGRSIT